MSGFPARVVITGGHGFLGWHTSCQLRAGHGIAPVRLGREQFDDAAALQSAIACADVVIHLAGVNRADTARAVELGNLGLATRLAEAVRSARRPVHIVYGNSIRASRDDAYGRGKAKAADILQDAVAQVGGSLANVLLPNLFGEHGRPHYNSFVSTFSYMLSVGETPEVHGDTEVPLLHAQDAASVIIRAAAEFEDQIIEPSGEFQKVSSVLERLTEFRDIYATGEIPPLLDPFAVNLFNTFRSHLFPQHFPIYPTVNEDSRGELFEAVRAHGGTGMTFVSTTRPGRMRGDHYHLRKIERFFVISGEAEISVRRLYDDKVVRFRLSGDKPGFVDMPTMWVHNISNVGVDDLVTVFWADQLLDNEKNPDQYPARVDAEKSQL